MIVDEKSMLQPPPPYASSNAPPPFHNRSGALLALSALPSHLLLHIVYMTFPQTSGVDETRLARQRKTLYWFSIGLRLVNRAFYIGKHLAVAIERRPS